MDPVLVPSGGAPPARLLALADGLLLPGGVDLVPQRYGEDPHPTTESEPALDELELRLLGAALAEGRPVLAICRGFQALNVALGGTLVQDLASQREGAVDHRPERGRRHLAHGLRVAADSQLGAALGTTHILVNSLHHQGVAQLASALRPTGWAEDGLVEAAEVPGPRFVVGVQFHPEELWRDSAPVRGLFAAFGAAIRAAARDRNAGARTAPGGSPPGPGRAGGEGAGWGASPSPRAARR